jgi:DNA processing protein
MSHEAGDWLALRLTRGVGDTTFHRLLQRFGAPGAVFGRDAEELVAAGLSRPTAARLAKGRDSSLAEAQIRAAREIDARIVHFSEPGYPAALGDLEDAPPVLWVLGHLPEVAARRVAIVGTRAPDGYGLAQALRLAGGCARAGCWVISGGARGIDAAAHEGALSCAGRTLVVLGSGLDVPYPGEHRDLFARVVKGGGAVVSELPLGARATRGTFPRRNRLIAALGEALVVVQAGERSGALLTAADARRLGRSVLAVPGPVDRTPSAGVHRLLRAGATLCEGPADVLAALGMEAVPEPVTPREPPGAEGERVLRVLGDGPAPFDEIAARSGLSLARAAEVLLTLEIQGYIGLERGFYRKKG